MPFVSQAQRAFLYANHPAVAAEFEAHTPKGQKLPARVKSGDGERARQDMIERRKKAAK